MSDATRGQLEKAYNLIQEERLDEAVAILRGIVTRQPNNGDAWWLMANAVSEPEQAYEALSNLLRLNPNHVEAREAYDQLVSQFPMLLKGATAQLRTPATADEEATAGVDIDALLRSTGPLVKGKIDPLSKPEGVDDVSESYLDDLWATKEAEKKAAEARAAEISSSDLDALFGNAAYDTPATSTEEEDLTAMFHGEQPKPSREAQPAAAAGLDDDLFMENDSTADTAILARTGELDMSLEDFFASPGGEDVEATARTQTPSKDIDLDEYFRGSAQSPFGGDAEPAFVKEVAEEGRGKKPGRRGKPEKQAAVAAVAEAAPEVKIPKAPKAEKPPKVVVIEEEAPENPFEAEQRANRRRSRPLVLVPLLIILIALVGVAILYNRAIAPKVDVVAQAAASIAQAVTAGGFTEVKTERQADGLKVEMCSLPGRALASKVYEAMDAIADQMAKVRAEVKNAQIVIVTCGNPDVRLYRATAPIEAVISYIDSNKANKQAYRMSWQPN